MSARFPHEDGIPVAVAEPLRLLFLSGVFAVRFGRSAWDFAVPIDLLRSTTASDRELRWLVNERLADFCNDIPSDDGRRKSTPFVNRTRFGEHACFVITKTGMKLAGELWGRFDNGQDPAQNSPMARGIQPGSLWLPRWDSEQRSLFVATTLLKQYRQPSPDQERILCVFEEEGWPYRIDDPLSLTPGRNPKRHLHQTIANLNRYHRRRIVHFHGDGTGQGICWRLRTPAR
jgi:hypothetical protein